MNRLTIMKEIKRLLKDGIIDSSIYDDIEKYYSKDNSRAFNNTLVVIATILIAMGIIFLFAYNWQAIPRLYKSSLIILLLITAQGLVYYSTYYRPRYRSASGVFLFAMVGISIAMISQMYNISGSDRGFILTWCILALPILYITRSSLVALFYSILVASYIAIDLNIFIILGLAIPLFLIKAEDRDDKLYHRFLYSLSRLIILLSSITWFSMTFRPKEGVIIIFTISLIFIIHSLEDSKLVAWVLLTLIMFSLTYMDLIDFDLSHRGAYFAIVVFILSFILGMRTTFTPLHLSLIIPLLITFGVFNSIVPNIILFVQSILYIHRGTNSGDRGDFNSGSLILVTLLGNHLFNNNYPILIKASVFIGAGIFILICSRYLIRGEANE